MPPVDACWRCVSHPRPTLYPVWANAPQRPCWSPSIPEHRPQARGVTSGEENGGRQKNEGEARNATRTAVGVVVAGELSPSVFRRPQWRWVRSSSSSLQSVSAAHCALACAPLVVASCPSNTVQEEDEKGMSRPCLETLRRAPVAWHPLSVPRRVPVQARRHAAPYPPALLPARGPCTVPATVPGAAPAGRYRDPSSRSARAHPT